MSAQPTYRPVHKALHRPLTVCGVDRRLFFLALLMGGATFNLFYSFWSGILVFLGLYGFSLWATTGAIERQSLPGLVGRSTASIARTRFHPAASDVSVVVSPALRLQR